MKALIGGIAAVLLVGGGVLWTVLSFTIGGIRGDVSDIRTSLHDLRGADKESIQEMNAVNTRLTDQISGLRTDFVKYSERFDALSNRMEAVNKSVLILGSQIDKFQSQLSAT